MLKYSFQKPTKEGRYFVRFIERGKVVWVKVRILVNRGNDKYHGGWRVTVDTPTEFGTPLKFYSKDHFEWAGPIPEPIN